MQNSPRESLARALREYRERKQLTQKDLAQLCNITQTTVSEIENGKANPTLDVLLKLAAALQVPLAGLVGGGMILGALGGLLGPPAVGAVVGALLGRAKPEGYEGWVANKLMEGVTEAFDKKS
jgi:transcriptional regulator with XRE-family HTH domain